MEVGEVAVGSGGPVERLDIRDQLNQITRCETRGETQVPQYLHQQPAGVAARPARLFERVVRGLYPRLHPDQITNLALELLVQTHQHGHRTVGRADRGAKTL